MSNGTIQQLQLQLERAQALIELGRFDQAALLLRQLLASEPNIAPAWCLFAQTQIGLDDAKAGLDAAERAAALEPENDWPHRLRSVALQQLGDLDGAIAAAREAVSIDPHNWQTHRRLAVCLIVAQRDADYALAAAERAVALAPHEPAAHHTLGLANEFSRNHIEAEESYRQSLALDPQYGPAHDALARRKLASSRFGRAGNLAAAAAGFRTAFKADPHSDYSARNLELTLRVFLGRLSYLIFVIAYLNNAGTRNAPGDRIGPLLLLAIPAVFAYRFLVRLEPDLRAHLRYIAFRGKLAAPSIAQLCAITLLLVSAAAPAADRTGLGVTAFVMAALARLLLLVGNSRRGRFLSASSGSIIVFVFALTMLFLLVTTFGGGFNPARGIVAVLLTAAAVAFYAIRRQRPESRAAAQGSGSTRGKRASEESVPALHGHRHLAHLTLSRRGDARLDQRPLT
jgi:tetratricopeptide (TPR) repeat protein